MVGSKQVASKRCKIKVHAFPHASESNLFHSYIFPSMDLLLTM